jgi:hypothetical protein
MINDAAAFILFRYVRWTSATLNRYIRAKKNPRYLKDIEG